MSLFDIFRSDPKKKAMKKTAEAYSRVMSFSKGDKTNLIDADKQSDAFVEMHAEVISDYIKSFSSEKSSQEIDNLIQAYFRRFPDQKPAEPVAPEKDPAQAQEQESTGDTSTDVAKEESKPKTDDGKAKRDNVNEALNQALSDTELNIDQEQSEEDKEKLSSEGIKPAALKGLKDISMWMLRNGSKTGAYGGNEKVRFVNNGVLKESARVKLFAYYLVEKGLEEESNNDSLKMALAVSQLNYVPNLESFKSKVIASKFKFWKRFDASHFDWHKIAVAIRLAIKNSDMIKPFGSLGTKEVSSSDAGSPDETKDAVEKQASKDTAAGNSSAGSEKQDSNKTGQEAMEEQIKKREKALATYIKCGQEIMELREKVSKEKSTKKKAEYNNKVRAKMLLLGMYFRKLKEQDVTVENAFRSMIYGDIIDPPEEEEEKELPEQIGEVAEKIGDKLEYKDKPKEMMEYINTGSEFLANLNPSWNLGKISDEALNFMDNLGPTNDILEMIGHGISAYNFILKVIKLKKERSTMTAGTLALESMDLINEALELASSITETIMGIAGAAEDLVSAVSTGFGFVTGTLNVIQGTTTAIVMQQQKNSLKEAEKKLSKDDKAQRIARLGTRIADIRQDEAIAKTVAGTLELTGGVLTAAGVSSVVGAVIGGVGTAIKLTSDIVTYFRKKRNVATTIDEYINIDKMMQIIKANVKVTDGTSMDEEEVKEQLREEMITRLHYADNDDMYEDIIAEYAAYIHKRIFYKENDEPLREITSENEGYIKLLAGFGAKPDFDKRKPGAKTIAEYMKKI